jgi:hypothetical protein
MKPCCPRNHGCNARSGNEQCALDVLRALDDPDATRALTLWGVLAHGEQTACPCLWAGGAIELHYATYKGG